ncbi:MAG: hypothetical protein MUE85_22360 [Microscillaceae bacterium]|jgi:hypothetical protein|nr:hypothetical protein [Microscillaceae bacterium]
MNLLAQELEYLQNTDFLLTKIKITQKLNDTLANLRDSLRAYIHDSSLDLPIALDYQVGKISKGENYRGLPYLVLDYPKLFKTNQIWAFRTMVWWGKAWSCTLHLQGEMWHTYQSALIDNRQMLDNQAVYICIHSQPWEYHYESDNYVAWDILTEAQRLTILQDHPFLKLSRTLALHQLSEAEAFSLQSFHLFCRAMGFLSPQ